MYEEFITLFTHFMQQGEEQEQEMFKEEKKKENSIYFLLTFFPPLALPQPTTPLFPALHQQYTTPLPLSQRHHNLTLAPLVPTSYSETPPSLPGNTKCILPNLLITLMGKTNTRNCWF